MLFGGTRRSIGDVFTPRRTEVNRAIYIQRPELEKELRRAISGTKHVVVHGESGSGKSWLYKTVLANLGAEVRIANSPTALRLGSLTNEIRNVCGLPGTRSLVGTTEEADAGLRAVFAEANITSGKQYTVAGDDPLLEAFAKFRSSAGNKLAILVIDNLELILKAEELMAELASIISLLDDARFEKHQIKILMVGVPSVLREYFNRTPAASSVANRLTEVSEVSSLEDSQVDSLVEKGFRELLEVQVPDDVLKAWQGHINHVTIGYAQAVQEYCEQLAYVVEDAKWIASASCLKKADEQWLKLGLSHASQAISGRMNVRETTKQRRNQVLYALGKIEERWFNASQVEALVRNTFPDSTAGITLAIGQVLSDLAKGDSPIVKQMPDSSEYAFKDARIAMALRLLEIEPETQRVKKASEPT